MDIEILSSKEVAFLIIDMQHNFIDEADKHALVPRHAKIIDFCKEKSISIGVITYRDYGPLVAPLENKINTTPRILVTQFEKYFDDAFSVWELNDWLKSKNTKSILLGGVNACACVHKTAETGLQIGYNVLTSSDLIAGYCDKSNCEIRQGWYQRYCMFTQSHQSIMDKII